MKIGTIGYGGLKSVAEILACLPGNMQRLIASHDSRVLIVDVRRTRKSYIPAEELDALGCNYLWVKGLGNVSGNGQEWKPFLGLARAKNDLDLVADMIKRTNLAVVLLCAEKDVRQCHRRLVAEALAERVDGLEIVHFRQ